MFELLYSSVLPPGCRLLLNRKTAEMDEYNRKLSTLASNSPFAFLAIKLPSLECEIAYVEIYQQALKSLHVKDTLSTDQYLTERDRCESLKSEKLHESFAIKLEERVLVQDMEETPNQLPVSEAYAASIVARIHAATGNQVSQHVNRSRFKANVVERYNAKGTEDREGQAWCHVLGWQSAQQVRAAHLVPKALGERELSHIFGATTKPATDPKNALTLHEHIEQQLDKGGLVFVPVDETEAEWECVITDGNLMRLMATNGVFWKDIHKKRLRFRGENRPAKRYLYLRFLATYIAQKWAGNTAWAENIETRRVVWTSPGKYLRSSMLQVLTQKAFGEDMSAIFTGTFVDDEPSQSEAVETRNQSFAQSMIEALRTSEMAGSGDLNDSDEE